MTRYPTKYFLAAVDEKDEPAEDSSYFVVATKDRTGNRITGHLTGYLIVHTRPF